MVHKSIRESRELLYELLESKLTNLSKAKFVEMLVSGSITMRAYGAGKDRIELVPQGNETPAAIKEHAQAISKSNFVTELGGSLPSGITLVDMHPPPTAESGTFNTFQFELDRGAGYQKETFFVVLRYPTARGAAGAAAQKNFADCLTMFLTGNGATAVTVESNKEGQQTTDVVAKYTMGSTTYMINFEVKSLEKGSTVSFFEKTHMKAVPKPGTSHDEADKIATRLLGVGKELRNYKRNVFFSGDPLPIPSIVSVGRSGRIDNLTITNNAAVVTVLQNHWKDDKDDFFVISNAEKYTIFSTSDQPKPFPGFSMPVFPPFDTTHITSAKFGTYGGAGPGRIRAALKIDVKLLNNFDCNLKLVEVATRTESSAMAGGAISGVQVPLGRGPDGKPATGDSKSKKKILSKNAKVQGQSWGNAKPLKLVEPINETRDLLWELLFEAAPLTVGDVKTALKYAKGKKLDAAKSAFAKRAAQVGAKTFLSFVPGLGGLSDAIEAGADIKDIYDAASSLKAKDKKKNPVWDKLSIDPGSSSIVDDGVETQFLKDLSDKIEIMRDDEELPDVDTQLANYLKDKFDGSHIAKKS